MSIKGIRRFQDERKLHKQPYSWENEVMNVLEEMLEAKGYDVPSKVRESFLRPIAQYIRSKAATNPAIIWKEPTIEEKVDSHGDQIVFNVGAIMKLGYEPSSVLDEVSREINSRDGKIIKGKFEKFLPGDKGYNKPYKADFSKCKL